jgi:cytochrome P450
MTGQPLSDDLMAPEVIRNPHAYYRRLREVEPVHWNAKWGGWVLTRYDDVVKALRDSQRLSADRMGFLANEIDAGKRAQLEPIFRVLSRWMVFADPPLHTKLRLLLNPLFTPTAVEKYRPMVRGIVTRLLDEIEGRGQMEVVRDFAYQVPMTVILELMGAPDVDTERIKAWSEELGTFFFIRADEPQRREIAVHGVNQLVEHLTPMIEARRARRGNDLVSLLIDAEEHGQIEADDVLATCVLLVFGGHETTMNLIANGTLALATHPDQWARLAAQPELVPTGVEELLRYDGSVKATVRWAKTDIETSGQAILAGQRLLVGLSAANRDPAVFAHPDGLDVGRNPNPHVAFAQGIHICLGAPLARLEAQEAFATLTRRLPCPTVNAEALDYHPTVVGRALKALPVSWS